MKLSAFSRNASSRPLNSARPGARRKQQLAEIAAAGEDRFAALLQALVVEREHHAERGAVDAGKLRLQDALVDRPVVGVDQAVPVALETGDLVRAARQARAARRPAWRYRRASSPLGLRRAVGRLLFDAEQEVEDRRGRGRLARLVESVDDVEIRALRRRGAEIDRIVAEPAVASEIEPRDPHAARSVSAARRCASTSSAPSRAMARRISAKASEVAAEQVLARSRRQMAAQILGDRAIRPGTPSTARPPVPSARAIRRPDRSRPASASARLLAGELDPVDPGLADAGADPATPPLSLSASERSRQASGVAPQSFSRATRCSLCAAHARLSQAPPRSASAPPASPRRPKIDRDAPELGDARRALLERNRAGRRRS